MQLQITDNSLHECPFAVDLYGVTTLFTSRPKSGMKPELLPWHLYLSRSHPPRTALGNRSIESSGQVPVLSSHKLVFFLFFFFSQREAWKQVSVCRRSISTQQQRKSNANAKSTVNTRQLKQASFARHAGLATYSFRLPTQYALLFTSMT